LQCLADKSTEISLKCLAHCKTTTPYHNRFTALFPGLPGWAGARRELLDFMVQGKINRGRHTNHPAGRHSIRTNQCPPPPLPTAKMLMRIVDDIFSGLPVEKWLIIVKFNSLPFVRQYLSSDDCLEHKRKNYWTRYLHYTLMCSTDVQYRVHMYDHS